ncbi:hypothetical protein [Uliginosibacterium sp. 31-12]|uniref:hypothetical protein n=1 Tax=Uliginosibacterium sp. 31-12 TaxID=3062781 RepID=UPI0026E40387|nr:hypothetical protein [Uliginosibacterium sp. 31-12]MDO6384703.1 hypothetical protein [Uliginosibacterium sp. 31-12]
MGNKKKSDGVIATIERLTGQVPCPVFLRNSLNKYLYEEALFEGASKGSASKDKVQGKLTQGETDALVMNVLNLDQVFNGATATVVRIASGKAEKKELEDVLDRAGAELQRRFDAYGYWVQRMGQLKEILGEGDIDLKKVRLDELIKTPSDTSVPHHQNPFALRAFQQLERIEGKGRLGVPTANELVEQADAYLALGDMQRATLKACAALEADKANARAWFIRVMAALRARNTALNQMRHQEMIAQEVAEPMSAHEAWAYEMASEEQGKAADCQMALSKILPQALLHWPKYFPNSRSYEHGRERHVVRDLFINAIFAKVAGPQAYPRNYYLNGLEAEWKFVRENSTLSTINWEPDSGAVSPPLDSVELTALQLLLQERDDPNAWSYESVWEPGIGREFKLLHLRWALQLGGYSEHWGQFKELISRRHPQGFEDEVLGDELMSRIWQVHVILNDGSEGLHAAIDTWVTRTSAEREEVSDRHRLRQFAWHYHHRYVRSDSSACVDIAQRAQVLVEKLGDRLHYSPDSMDCPDDESVWMPICSRLYWKYLEVLAVLQMSPAAAGDEGLAMLLGAESLAESFRDVEKCFWRQVEMYEGGGGDEFEIPPYGVDLRDTDPWILAATAYMGDGCETESSAVLPALVARLAAADRPFAPLGRDFFVVARPDCSD